MSPLIKMFVSRLRKIYKGTIPEMKGKTENIIQWEVGEMLRESFTISIIFSNLQIIQIIFTHIQYVCGNHLFLPQTLQLVFSQWKEGGLVQFIQLLADSITASFGDCETKFGITEAAQT